MKNLKKFKRVTGFITLIVLLSLFVSSNIFAGGKNVEKILKAAEKNLSKTLQGDNENLRGSAIQVVLQLKKAYPNYKFKKVIIPLMRILRNHENQNIRILAALSLYELGNEIGVYAVKEASRFDDNKMVRHICLSLTIVKKTEQQEQNHEGLAAAK